MDDAIVMLENIVRHIELGETPMKAAFKGSAEVGFTIVSMTISLAAVFIPIVVHERNRRPAVPRVRGHDRRGDPDLRVGFGHTNPDAVQPFPARASHGKRHGWFYALTERFFDAMLRVYERTLRFTLRHRSATLMSSFVILIATLWLFTKVPKGFIPVEDTNQIFALTEAPQGTSHLQRFEGCAAGAEASSARNPNIE